MKAILEFTLPEESDAHHIAVHAMDWALTVWDFDQWLRNAIKYEGKDYQDVRDELHGLMESRGISMEDIT